MNNAFLQFYQESEKLFAIPLANRIFRIGRDYHCEMQIEDPSLSRLHCIIRKKEERWMIEDSSSNGIFVDDTELPRSLFPLEENRRYQLGKSLAFEFISEKTSAELKSERTVLTSRRKTQALVLSASESEVRIGEAILSGINSKGESFRRYIDPQGISIGSHPSNDIILQDESVSQFHARIDLSQNRYQLVDLGSTNGSFVQGIKISKAPLPLYCEIEIGRSKLEFEIEERKLEIENKAHDRFFGMVSRSTKMRKLFSLLEAVSPTEAPVFLHGETGTGKELMAKAIHELSSRADGPFIALNCSALPKDLMESELFGYEKGAFTGANETRIGAFEAANAGSLFLDELADMDPALQAKLLRVLETGEVKRLGSQKLISTSVRVISATHKDLSKLVAEGKFREDLYYRLHVVPVNIIPLRERKEDFEVLIPELFKQLKMKATLTGAAMESLKSYDFPGNIRELKNSLQRAHVQYQLENPLGIAGNDIELDIQHFQFIEDFRDSGHFNDPQKKEERERLLEMLRSNDFNQSKTASQLGIAVSSLHDKLKRLEIDAKKEKAHLRLDRATGA